MCQECNKRRWEKERKAYSELSEEFGFVDEYSDGFGWWSNPETQARIVARQEAWKAISINNAWIDRYSFTPSVAKSMGDKLALLPCIGKTTVAKIQALSADADDKFLSVYNSLYDNPDSWVWRYVKHNFERVRESGGDWLFD